MICDICGEEYFNENGDVLIQRNIKTGLLVCMDCAFQEGLRKEQENKN